MKTFRNYRGVKIYRVKTKQIGTGPEFGCTVKFDVNFMYTDGYPCDTLDEVKNSVDALISDAEDRGCTEAEMVETLNAGEIPVHWL